MRCEPPSNLQITIPWSILSTYSSRAMNWNTAATIECPGLALWDGEWLVSAPIWICTIKEINRCMQIRTKVPHFCWGKDRLYRSWKKRDQATLLIIWSNLLLQEGLKLFLTCFSQLSLFTLKIKKMNKLELPSFSLMSESHRSEFLWSSYQKWNEWQNLPCISKGYMNTIPFKIHKIDHKLWWAVHISNNLVLKLLSYNTIILRRHSYTEQIASVGVAKDSPLNVITQVTITKITIL